MVHHHRDEMEWKMSVPWLLWVGDAEAVAIATVIVVVEVLVEGEDATTEVAATVAAEVRIVVVGNAEVHHPTIEIAEDLHLVAIGEDKSVKRVPCAHPLSRFANIAIVCVSRLLRRTANQRITRTSSR